MQTLTGESLLDEAGFIAELATLEDGLTTTRQSPLTTPPGMFVDESGPAADELEEAPSVLGHLAAAAMFVLMMGVGAAGAALVFHDRVARILAIW